MDRIQDQNQTEDVPGNTEKEATKHVKNYKQTARDEMATQKMQKQTQQSK